MIGVQAVGEADAEDQATGLFPQQAGMAVDSMQMGEGPANANKEQSVQQDASDKALKSMTANLEKMRKESDEETKQLENAQKQVVAEKLSVAAATNAEADKMIGKTKKLLDPSGEVAASQQNAADAKAAVEAADRKISEIKSMNNALVEKSNADADSAGQEAEQAAQFVQADKVAQITEQIKTVQTNAAKTVKELREKLTEFASKASSKAVAKVEQRLKDKMADIEKEEKAAKDHISKLKQEIAEETENQRSAEENDETDSKAVEKKLVAEATLKKVQKQVENLEKAKVDAKNDAVEDAKVEKEKAEVEAKAKAADLEQKLQRAVDAKKRAEEQEQSAQKAVVAAASGSSEGMQDNALIKQTEAQVQVKLALDDNKKAQEEEVDEEKGDVEDEEETDKWFADHLEGMMPPDEEPDDDDDEDDDDLSGADEDSLPSFAEGGEEEGEGKKGKGKERS